tara:strand:+ start:2711 stop:3097 length:387 start_codon:yes stop_codon:yes gene_type:complete
MIIHGIGVDIVDIRRIKKAFDKNKKFQNRVFSKLEINNCFKIKKKFNCFAKRFAAKEAFSKALGTGISGGLKFNEIEVYNKNTGHPNIKVKGQTKYIINKTLGKKKYKILLSISDENYYALAMVLILI